MTFDMLHRGASVAYELQDGHCVSWEIEDIDDPTQFKTELERAWPRPAGWRLGSRMTRGLLLFCLGYYDRLKCPEQLKMLRVVNELALELWDDEIQAACEQHYLDEIGGPAGEFSYFFGEY